MKHTVWSFVVYPADYSNRNDHLWPHCDLKGELACLKVLKK